MSAEPKRVTRPEVWTRWEGQIVKGVFPLRRFLGSSDQGAVFLSEYDTGKASNVAIKVVPAVASQAEARLAHWRAAAALSHPNLVRLFDMGRCQLGGREYLFVVMEYGEQTLAEFLAQRVLSADEVRALLLPTLDALSFLHSNQMAHAQLKPSNFLVVSDQLKLSSDVIRPFGHRGVSAADDVRSLGLTLVEAFTQRVPSSPDEHNEASSLLANVPAPYGNMLRRCLNPDPANRPTVEELLTQYKAARENEVPSDDDQPHAHPWLLAIPIALLGLLVVMIGPQPSENAAPAELPPPEAPAPEPVLTSKKPTPAPKPKPKPSRTVSTTASPVVREVTPDVPQSLRDKIDGRILVTVRVLVDASGDVMAAMTENPGPSRNLANLADQAAREWKFLPAEKQGTRVWILTFAFTQEGVTARATAV